MMKNPLLISSIISSIFLIVGCTGISIPQTAVKTVPPLPLPREIESNSTGVVELWRTSIGSYRSIPILSQEQVILNFGPEYGNIQNDKIDGLLTAYQIETGQVNWQSPLPDPGFRTHFEKQNYFVAIDRLFLIYSSRVQAFSLDTGDMLWQTPELRTHSSYYFGVQNEPEKHLLIYAKYFSDNIQDEILVLDSNTGQLLSTSPYSAHYVTFYGPLRFNLIGQELVAFEWEKNEVLWKRSKYRPEAELFLRPIFLTEDIIFQEGRVFYKIVRLNMYTGEVVWETDEVFISNIAVNENRVYAFRDDGALVAFDLESGLEIGELQFSFPPYPEEIRNSTYWVETKDKYIVLLTSDHHELVVFKENN